MNRRGFLKLLVALPFIGGSLKGLPKITVPLKSSSVDFPLLLESIAKVETGGDDTKIGREGERSRYQISKQVWDQYWGGHRPFNKCWGEAAYYTGLDHLHFLDNNIPRISETEKNFREYALAWCWCGGLSSWNNKTVFSTKNITLNNYATRVCNLYIDRLETSNIHK